MVSCGVGQSIQICFYLVTSSLVPDDNNNGDYDDEGEDDYADDTNNDIHDYEIGLRWSPHGVKQTLSEGSIPLAR